MIALRYTPNWARLRALDPAGQPALLRLASAWITSLCLISALARIALLGGSGVPGQADLHLGTLFLAVLLLRGLVLDGAATGIVGGCC